MDRSSVDFSHAPYLVIWEIRRAPLARVDCQANASSGYEPRELATEEGFVLVDQVRAFGPEPRLLVLTGDDPARRRDLAEVVRYAAAAGLTVTLTLSATAAAERKRLAELKDAGLSGVAVSLDGPDSDKHDAFRRVRGSYASTVRTIKAASELGLPLQINTTISRMTLPHLVALAGRVGEFPLTQWAVFFLVRTGPGAALEQISAHQSERVLGFLYDLSLKASFSIKTIEAPHYQRVIWERERAASRLSTRPVDRRRQVREPLGVKDGHGMVFVDHVGNIRPSGFLPVSRGNVRTADLAVVYRHDEVFRRLRNSDALLGKCRHCRFREICGGSRSRSFAATGALMASDPLCVYEPGPQVEPLLPLS